ncbi:MAG: 7-carboxy-7-deazaguanine synthase QueE [Gammaproteobacteria bacterium RIFCSPHIGHO2_12_FULL_41_20]|nr:MAG: 7-carboxy-7-deazaguanine synthase QueE [Gammaproteobacteria bacterium RIFCSPHIGHO2_12_FULL_41_20]
MARLRITEIFCSLQGETRTVGIPTTFIRLTGCPLRCHYCDTSYAFQGGAWYDMATVLERVRAYGASYVTVTGGEPLAQKACFELLQQLCDSGYHVSLETSGALDITQVDNRVIKVVDIKTPGSGMVDENNWQNIKALFPDDQVKFVICHRVDYEWAKSIMEQYQLSQVCEILFSPSYTQLTARELADWIVQDRLPVRFQLQLHKYLWGEEPGR